MKWLQIETKFVSTQPLHHEQDGTQGQLYNLYSFEL